MTAKHDGIKLVIAGTELVVPPLNVKALKKLTLAGHFDKLSKPDVPQAEMLEAEVEIILASIQRNHPTIDRDWIEENVELHELPLLLAAVLSASKFKERKGEDGSPNAESP